MASNKIKDLRVDGLTHLQALSKYVIGNMDLDLYDSNRVYNTNDYSLIADGLGGYDIIKCKEDNVTGVYNLTKWDIIPPIKSSIDCGTF